MPLQPLEGNSLWTMEQQVYIGSSHCPIDGWYQACRFVFELPYICVYCQKSDRWNEASIRWLILSEALRFFEWGCCLWQGVQPMDSSRA